MRAPIRELQLIPKPQASKGTGFLPQRHTSCGSTESWVMLRARSHQGCTLWMLMSSKFLKLSIWGLAVSVPVAMTETPWPNQNNLGRREGLFLFTVPVTVHHRGMAGQELRQGRNHEAGAHEEVMEECCLWACSSRIAQSAFLKPPGPYAQGLHCT